MSGREFAERYRTRGGTAPIIVLSAAQDIEQEAARIGTAQLIPKPFDMDRLVTMITAATRARENGSARAGREPETH